MRSAPNTTDAMNREQALSVLSGLLNSPVARLALSIKELSACELALRTLADASAPAAPSPVPASGAGKPGESPAQP